MRVILIPCSGGKNSGGSSPPSSLIRPALSNENWFKLCHARDTLGRMLGLEPGPDLGNAPQASLPLLPAWKRYNGNLYRKAAFAENDLNRSGLTLLIVSALFGVINAQDPIRDYDVAMTDRLPDGTRVNRFWKSHNLASIVGDILVHLHAREVYDFLSGDYRAAVDRLTEHLPSGCEYFAATYPGMGSGSNYYRGMDIRGLLAR